MHVKNIHCMVEELASGLKSNVNSKMKPGEVGLLGETVDMLKDLCEAEYYSRLAKMLEKEEEEEQEELKELLKELKKEYGEEEGEKRFYDDYRYKNGRFAPKGRGRRMRRGYTEPPYFMAYPWDDEIGRGVDYDNMRMYSVGRMGPHTRGGNESIQGVDGTRSRYGYSHDNYIREKMEHPGMDDASKQRRMEKLNERLADLEEMAKETINGMSPEEKQAWRVKINKILNM